MQDIFIEPDTQSNGKAVPGVTDLQLQNLGYWCSDIFSKYTRITESSVTDLVKQMLEKSNTKALPDIIRCEM